MFRLITAFVIAAGLAAPAAAQSADTAGMDMLRQRVKTDKKAIVAENLKLTEPEAIAFWPVYDAYQRDLAQLNQRLSVGIVAYADAYNTGAIANDVAKKLLDESLAIEDAEVKLKTALVPKVMAVLPAAKAARYIQMESKIRAAVRYELAASIPLVP